MERWSGRRAPGEVRSPAWTYVHASASVCQFVSGCPHALVWRGMSGGSTKLLLFFKLWSPWLLSSLLELFKNKFLCCFCGFLSQYSPEAEAGDQEVKVSLDYIGSLKPGWATWEPEVGGREREGRERGGEKQGRGRGRKGKQMGGKRGRILLRDFLTHFPWNERDHPLESFGCRDNDEVIPTTCVNACYHSKELLCKGHSLHNTFCPAILQISSHLILMTPQVSHYLVPLFSW